MYTVQLTKPVTEFIRGQPPKIQRQLTNKLKRLKENPRPYNCRKIKGADNIYRLKSGDYRIVYQVFDNNILVLVLRIGHRDYVYKRLTN